MARNRISFNIVDGGLGTPLATDDHITLLIGNHTAAPASYGTNLMKSFRGISQVEAAGIKASEANYKLDHYIATEYFRVHPQGELYIGYKNGDFTADEVNQGANGAIKYIGKIGTDADIAKLQTLATGLAALNVPVYGCVLGLDTVADMSSLTDLGTLSADFVSVLIGGDGHTAVVALATALSKDYIPNIGAFLGLRSMANVHESIMWREKFNCSDGEYMDSLVLADGKAYDNDGTLLTTLHDNGYLYFEHEQGLSGAFLNDSHTATSETSDFSAIERNATVYKALRLVNEVLAVDKGRPLYVEKDGTLSPSIIGYFKAKCGDALGTMTNAGELSNYEVLIDAEQDVLTTSTLEIGLRLQPVGVARNIEVTMSFSANIG